MLSLFGKGARPYFNHSAQGTFLRDNITLFGRFFHYSLAVKTRQKLNLQTWLPLNYALEFCQQIIRTGAPGELNNRSRPRGKGGSLFLENYR